MGLFEHWPYTNFHDLNLNWIIEKLSDLKKSVDDANTAKESAEESSDSARENAAIATAAADALAGSVRSIQTLTTDVNVLQSQLNTFISGESGARFEKVLYQAETVAAGLHYVGQTVTLLDDPSLFDVIEVTYNNSGSNSVYLINPADLTNAYVGAFIYAPETSGSNLTIKALSINRDESLGTNGYRVTVARRSAWDGAADTAAVAENATTSSQYYGGTVVKIKGVRYATDAELHDIRIGANGTVYPTAGSAVRAQVDALQEQIDVVVEQRSEEVTNDTDIMDRSLFTAGIKLPNGSVVDASSIGYLNQPLRVYPGDVITATKYYYNSAGTAIGGSAPATFRACAFYADDTFTPENLGFSSNTESFTVPDGVAYIQPSIGFMTGTYDYVQIHRASIVTSYAFSDALENMVSSPRIVALNNGTLPLIDLANNIACALPKTAMRFTVGIPETWYYKNMVTPETKHIIVDGGYSATERIDEGVVFENAAAVSSSNGYRWRYYDPIMNMVAEYLGDYGLGGERRVLAENLSNCSMLAIGDSTIDQDVLTGSLLTYFSDRGANLTLLGTLGPSAANRNEGRAGWTSSDYMADTTKNGYTNPFWNPTTSAFDFTYYMNQQGYASVDYVVIQLGINDLYPRTSFEASTSKAVIWNNIKTMIDSILAFNANIRIIINLPTTPNADVSRHPVAEFLYRNKVIEYNEYALTNASAYSESNVRVSYCHLILNPDTDISDNVHPNQGGYNKMALEIINQINVWQNGY